MSLMGILYYGSARIAIELDDRMLAHLQAVFLMKLRRHESFPLSWRDDQEVGDGRSTVWVTPSTDLHFKYAGGRVAQTDKDLLERLAVAAGSTHGIDLDEDASLAEAPHQGRG
jgi:hypothetical protein